MRERLIPERPAEEEDSRKGPEEGRGSASLVQGSGMMSWTRHGKEKGNGGTEEQEGRRKDGVGGEGKNVPASHHEDKDMRDTMKSEEDVKLQQAVEVVEQQECSGTVVTRRTGEEVSLDLEEGEEESQEEEQREESSGQQRGAREESETVRERKMRGGNRCKGERIGVEH